MSTPELQQYFTLAQEMMRRCYAEEAPEMMHQWLLDQLGRLRGSVEGNTPLLTWPESFDYYDQLLAKREADALLPEDQRKVVDWLWPSWNKMLDPLEPGMLAVISAGDGQGKTIYAESLAEYWARKKNRVVFLHYELNRAIVLDSAARHTSITRRDLKSGKLTPQQKELVARMRPALTSWDGYISYIHTAGWSMERTVQELHRLKVENQCDVVVLDYLEKNAPSRRQLQMFGTNSYQREADNVEQLKNFAESTETPVLMLAQMSKAGKTSSAETLDRSGMRGAGEKSEKANVVILLHREKIENGYSQKVDVVIDKNTLGPTGTFAQWMEPEYFRIQEMERVPLN